MRNPFREGSGSLSGRIHGSSAGLPGLPAVAGGGSVRAAGAAPVPQQPAEDLLAELVEGGLEGLAVGHPGEPFDEALQVGVGGDHEHGQADAEPGVARALVEGRGDDLGVEAVAAVDDELALAVGGALAGEERGRLAARWS